MMRSVLHSAIVFIAVFILAATNDARAVELDKPIKEIKIVGNQRADTNTIRFYIQSKEGEKYSVQKTRDDIRRIYELKYFDDIHLEIEEGEDGLILIYKVREKPFVQSVRIEGNTLIPDKEMILFLKLKKGTYFQKHLLKKDIDAIQRKYRKKGLFFTDVEPRVIDVGDNQVDINYHVDERKKLKITDVKFTGNIHFKDWQLTKIIESKPIGFFSFLSDSGNFQREILKTDVLKLEAMYHDAGYIKAKIEDPRVEVDRQNGMITITFVIHEEDRYQVGDITAKGDAIYSAEEILEKIQLKKGDPFNQSLFRKNMFDITEMYSDRGYAYANVLPDQEEMLEEKIINLKLEVDYGSKVYIGRINITGNEKTAENVIRREFRLHEGELFSSAKLRRTRERLVNLGYFDAVDINQKAGSEPDLIDTEVSLFERQTGNIRAGAGYSSVENVMLQAEISESNLMGTGRRLTLGMESSSLRHDYYINLVDPRFMDRDILLGFDLHTRQFDYLSYTSYTKGGSVSAGRGFGEYTKARLSYALENVRVALTAGETITTFLQAQEGSRFTSSLLPTVTIDSRDNYMSPSSGNYLQLGGQLAGGPLGGDLDFYKASIEASKFVPLPYEFIFMARGQVKYGNAYGSSAYPLFENYFLGGPYSLRGFAFRDVGPLDSNGEAIGGNASLLFNLEINYNFSKAIRGVLFYDRGQVYGSEGDLSKTTSTLYDVANMRHSVGFGLRFITPMAPISTIWGFKLDRKENEPAMEFHFSLGRFF